MGSLMAGWDTLVKDPSVKRNLSLTKEEIEEFWRLKKRTEEEHLQAITNSSKNNKKNTQEIVGGAELAEEETEGRLDGLIKTNGWWTKSSWAFLNEPPQTESRRSNYVPQFHVADLAKLHPNNEINA